MGLVLKPINRFLYYGWVVLLLISACTPVVTTTPTPVIHRGLPVDPAFKVFYDQLGGEAILGAIIAPVSDLNGITSQYSEGGLMLYDAKAPVDQQFSLAPLGRKLSLPEVQNIFPAQNDALVVNGFVIFSKFVTLYKEFDLTRYAGRPLSQPVVIPPPAGSTTGV